jgi:hypothetical protein
MGADVIAGELTRVALQASAHAAGEAVSGEDMPAKGGPSLRLIPSSPVLRSVSVARAFPLIGRCLGYGWGELGDEWRRSG